MASWANMLPAACGEEDIPSCTLPSILRPQLSGLLVTYAITLFFLVAGVMLGFLLAILAQAVRRLVRRDRQNGIAPNSRSLVVPESASGNGLGPLLRNVLEPLLDPRQGEVQLHPEECVHRQFLRRAEEIPEAVALRCVARRGGSGYCITFRQLRSSTLAAADALRAAGLNPGGLVALFLEGGPALVVSILGTWMAAGAWFPIDRDAPRARVVELATEARPALAVCDDKEPFLGLGFSLLSPDASGLQLVPCKDLADQHLRAAEHAHVIIGLDDVAQVIYTSGSTGVPKGVIFSHRRLAHASHFFAEQCDIRQGTRVLQKTPNIWSVFRHEVYPALCRGAEIVFPESARRKDPRHLAQVISEESVSVLVATPTIVELVLDSAGQGMPVLPSIRQVVFMGEVLTWTMAEHIHSKLSGPRAVSSAAKGDIQSASQARLQNFYGSTETENTVFQVPLPGTAEWTEATATGCRAVPAGRPQPCTAVHLLEPSSLAQTSPGQVGEICFGGMISDGYWARPELTSAKFILHPELGRLYRAGDLGKWMLPGWNLQVLGRLDRQVKIRGARVELEEVEARLLEAVQALGGTEAAAVATAVQGEDEEGFENDQSTSKHMVLVAFAAPAVLDVASLRRECEARLPLHMVPSVFRVVPALQRLPNGKTDLKGLAALAVSAAAEAQTEAETAAVPALDSLGMLRFLSKQQLEEDRWIQNQQAFWILAVMLGHFQLNEGAASCSGLDSGNAAWRLELLLGHGRDMVAFMLMLGFTDSRDPVQLGPRDVVLLIVALLMTFLLPALLSPGYGPLRAVFGPPVFPRIAHEWFLYSYLFARCCLLSLHRLKVSGGWQVCWFFVVACCIPDDLLWLWLPLARRNWVWHFDAAVATKGLRWSLLFLTACYLLSFHGSGGFVRRVQVWGRSCLRSCSRWRAVTAVTNGRQEALDACRAACFTGCFAAFLAISVLCAAEPVTQLGYLGGFQAVYVEGQSEINFSHSVSWQYMTHPSLAVYLSLWLGEMGLFLVPPLLVGMALAVVPWHLKTMGSSTFGNFVLHPYYIGAPWTKWVQQPILFQITSPSLGIVANVTIVFLYNVAFCVLFAHTLGVGFHRFMVSSFRSLAACLSKLGRNPACEDLSV
ncbi:unnamed protein product [Polarella glacialis]|uniref:AMP-dependent synthetase/ligase domain-containing protein n=1 Tax=Polarella glacialis TaxID=89957 RepID=A0A813IGJ9_POLGL|nr:unnamed protein product [Polarella glacialis]